MKLKLSLHADDRPTRAVLLTADASVTVGDVASALGRPATVPDDRTTSTLVIENAASESRPETRHLDPSESVIESGIRSGTSIRVVASAPSAVAGGDKRGRSVAMIRVLSGPDAGREFHIPVGTSTIGVSPADHVTLRDPSLAAAHATIVVAEDITVIDHGGPGGVRIGNTPVRRAFVGASDVISLGHTTLGIVHTQRAGNAGRDSPGFEFNRSPRVIARFEGEVVEAPEPPGRPEPTRLPIVSMLAPLLMGVVLFAITRNALTIAFIALSPLLMVGMYIDATMQAKKKQRIASRQFAESLRHAAAELESLQNVERAVRCSETPSATEAIDAIHRLGGLLWTHRTEHSGFLTLRLGLGDVESRTVVRLPSRTDTVAEYSARLAALRDQFQNIGDVPVVADLRSAGSLGVCGPRQLANGVARGLVVQLVGLHSPADVTVSAIVSSASRSSWEWLKWLPHVGSIYSPLAGDHLADDTAGGAALLARLDTLVRERMDAERPTDPRTATAHLSDGRPTLLKPVPPLPVVVVIIEDDAPVNRSRVTRLAELGPDVGIYVIWVASQLSNLPAVCRSFVLVETESAGSTAGEVRLGRHSYPIACENVAISVAEQVAHLLAPIVDVGVSIADVTDLPLSLPFLTLTGDGVAQHPDSILACWQATDSIVDRSGRPPRRRKIDGTLRAPIGSTGPDTFWLDLREHGPHALLGGTTGAGKSEFLQTWILGMATEHSPDRVNFLFVDYKGGTAFADCVRLPHTVGLVTDLAPHLVARALVSLRAEVRRREELLNAKHAKHLVSLERSGDPDTPPSLVIIVDEFAALAKEVPEFVDGVVDIAQRGRSLGLHLILATQRPAGVIKENLRANTNLRIALRMADADDSTDILGSADAAHFPPQVPGRAAAKIGNARIQAFQSGYTGGWTVGRDTVSTIEVADLAFGSGAIWEPAVPVESTDGDLGDPDIVHVVDTVIRAAADAAIPSPRRPWLPELAGGYDLQALTVEQTARSSSDAEITYAFGVADDPHHQSQPTAYFSPDVDGNLVVLGTGGSGKSTTLRALATSAAITEPGGAVQIYGIDCGTGGLRMLEALPTVGSIVGGDDDERVGRLLRRLVAEIAERAELFGPSTSTLPEYRAAAADSGRPRIILLVDGLAAFRELYETSALSPYLEMLVRIAGDGRAVGVHVMASAERHNAVPSSLGALIQSRIVMRLADDTDYLLAGAPRDLLAQAPPGRGHHGGMAIQVGVLGGSSDAAAQSAATIALASSQTANGAIVAPPVESLTDELPIADLPAGVRGLPAIGLRDVDLQACTVVPRGTLMVTGPPGSGRTGALATLVTAVKRAHPDMKTLLLTPRRSVLTDLSVWDATAVGESEVQTRVADFARYLETAEPGSLLVVIEAVTSFTGMAESDLLALIKTCNESDQLVVGEAEISTWSGSFAFAQAFKAARRGVLLHPGDLDADTYFNTPLARRRRTPLIPGRGYFIERGTAVRIQLAQTLHDHT